jgi:Putative peptidoglycan binding domain
MKTTFLSVALVASAATIAQANPGGFYGGGKGVHGGVTAHAAPAAHVPVRAGGFSSRSMPSMRSMPVRNFGGGMTYPRQRFSSSGMRSFRPTGFRQSSFYPNRARFTRSGPYTVATIPQRNRVAPFANRRNPAVTRAWNQRNTGTQFRNGNNLRNANNLRNGNNLRNANNFRNGNNLRNTNNPRNGKNHLRRDWQKHVFAHRSGDWHRDWNRNCDHWWNGHRCSFINGTWVIFNLGFSPWWPSYYPDDYYYDYGFPNDGYGSSTYGYDYPYSHNYDPGYDNSGDYQGQMYYDQNSYPDQSQGYYDSSVYQTEAYYDPEGYSDESQPNYSTVVAAQERLAREGYYHGESDGALGPEMRQALKNYQSGHGLRTSGYLDSDTVALMGLR